MALPGKNAQKRKAQEMLMHGLGNVLGYWRENEPNPFAPNVQGEGGDWVAAKPLTDEEAQEFNKVLLEQADRVAKMFGFDEAWSN